MPFDFDYGYTREQSVPFPAYPSGAKPPFESIYLLPDIPDAHNPLLIVKEDIINSAGRGLKRGFYETRLSQTADFLLLYQAGQLRAKIPVVTIEQRKPVASKKTKPKKVKKKKKNYKGTNPEDFVYNRVELRYSAEQESYIILWYRANVRVTAAFKVD
jgi:hypothetical protein